MDEARGSRMVAEMNLVYEDAFNMLCGDLPVKAFIGRFLLARYEMTSW